MRKFIVVISLAVFAATVCAAEASKPASDINAKIAQLDINKATIDDVIRIFGKPERYAWNNQTLTKNNLPETYIAEYPNRFQIVIGRGRVIELRFERQDTGYVFRDKIRIGSSLDEVLDVLGQPKLTIEGQANKRKDGVLYKDIDSRKGSCYYLLSEHGVRFIFEDYKVIAMYLTSKETGLGKRSGSFQDIKTIDSVNEYNDVRWKDMSKLNLSGRNKLIYTLNFNLKTIWPPPDKMPKGNEPNKILNDAMNPGLGVRELHKQGITGKGIRIAIIDQFMYPEHPEFAGKIADFHNLSGRTNNGSMHGPAVTSLLVGNNCGTAPDAIVFYAAVRDGVYEIDYVNALDWIIEQNRNLSSTEKIRVVSVSAPPGKVGTPSNDSQKQWAKAVAAAEGEGILVLDCTSEHGFVGKCWYDFRFPESIAGCKPGDPRYNYSAPKRPLVLAPTAPRTTAEQTDKNNFSYQYCGTAGDSWAIPYCAGVLAMGWQVNPELSSEQMRELLFKSAYVKETGEKIIYPENFIKMVKAAKAVPNKSK
ncbi:MAG: S8/S53 family peptidase [Planctomycetota bacterium]|nr:S8/S53 family peptidase [Planctomycetota bacterium]